MDMLFLLAIIEGIGICFMFLAVSVGMTAIFDYFSKKEQEIKRIERAEWHKKCENIDHKQALKNIRERKL